MDQEKREKLQASIRTRKKFNLKLTRLEESRIINSKENNSV